MVLSGSIFDSLLPGRASVSSQKLTLHLTHTLITSFLLHDCLNSGLSPEMGKRVKLNCVLETSWLC